MWARRNERPLREAVGSSSPSVFDGIVVSQKLPRLYSMKSSRTSDDSNSWSPVPGFSRLDEYEPLGYRAIARCLIEIRLRIDEI